jgi:hypothetical protein
MSHMGGERYHIIMRYEFALTVVIVCCPVPIVRKEAARQVCVVDIQSSKFMFSILKDMFRHPFWLFKLRRFLRR